MIGRGRIAFALFKKIFAVTLTRRMQFAPTARFLKPITGRMQFVPTPAQSGNHFLLKTYMEIAVCHYISNSTPALDHPGTT